MNKFGAILVVAAMVFIGNVSIHAHTISIGSFNAGTPGSVTLVMGTYDHGSGFPQGSITLTSGPTVPPTITNLFTSFTTVKPTGLIDGDNNFYADTTPATWGTAPADSFNSPTNTVGIGPVINWQGSTFTGLTAGVYDYTLSGMNSVNWTNINSFTNNWSGQITITDTSVTGNPVTEPGTYAMFGLGLLGLGYAKRRKRKLSTNTQ